MIRNACVNDGTVGSGHEARNARAVADVLDGLSLEVEWVEPQPGRTSLVARLRGTDPDAPSLALVGHTDVVPVEPEGWTRDPFGGELVDGWVWGRGAIDMLGLTSVFTVVTRAIAESGRRLRGDLVLAAVADEEHGSTWGSTGSRSTGTTSWTSTRSSRSRAGCRSGPGSRTIAVGRRAARGAGCASSGGRGTGRGRTARSTRSCSRLRPCGGSPSTAARS